MWDLSSPNSIPITANSSNSIKSLNWAFVFPFCFLKNEILYPIPLKIIYPIPPLAMLKYYQVSRCDKILTELLYSF